MRQKVLLVDDEIGAVSYLTSHLQSAGFDVVVASDVETALTTAGREKPNLILLDLKFPHIRGYDVSRRLKSEGVTDDVPVIILSANASEQDRILGFELGADDYIAKPFNVLELILRIKKSLARYSDNSTAALTKQRLTAGELTLDPLRHEVTLQSNPIALTPIEFKLLALLMGNQARAMEREVLFNGIWGKHNLMDSRTIDAHIKRLRQKLGFMGAAIETLIGFGYRLDANLAPTPAALFEEKTATKADHKQPSRGRRETKIVRYKNRKRSTARNSSLLQVAEAA